MKDKVEKDISIRDIVIFNDRLYGLRIGVVRKINPIKIGIKLLEDVDDYINSKYLDNKYPSETIKISINSLKDIDIESYNIYKSLEKSDEL